MYDTGKEVVANHVTNLNYQITASIFSMRVLYVLVSFVTRASGRHSYACQGLNNFWWEFEQYVTSKNNNKNELLFYISMTYH